MRPRATPPSSRSTSSCTRATAHSAFASCENVVSPALNLPALDVLCGDAGENCTPEKLFSYFGNNEFAPFNITYVWATEDLEDEANIWGNATLTLHPFDVSTTPCNTSDPAMHCQCSDCLPSCPAVPELPPPTQQKEPPVVSVDALTLSLALAYAMVAAAVVSASCFWSKVDQRGEGHPDNAGRRRVAGGAHGRRREGLQIRVLASRKGDMLWDIAKVESF
ncbi:uncharacterized protein LOC125044151 [Penaeus chinensis]|uniref:uncharacterized protein LOC125044151 n=1 Tax=Penaeus chinensis TaxID=139456 RepID=UPI001FB6E315|nr:uncharacterized protein LOC125044151 [Penaeus chinensis]